MPTSEGTEVSLSYVHCFLYIVSCLRNISLFHSAWLGTFQTDLLETTLKNCYLNEA